MPVPTSILRPALVTSGTIFGSGYLANHYTGKWMKRKIEERDRDFLGTDITIGKCDCNLWRGRVTLRDVNLVNPVQFKQPNLLTIGECVFDLEMLRLLRKGDIEIEEFTLKDVEILIEHEDVWGPDMLFGKSNIAVVLDYLQEQRRKRWGAKATEESACVENSSIKQESQPRAEPSEVSTTRVTRKPVEPKITGEIDCKIDSGNHSDDNHGTSTSAKTLASFNERSQQSCRKGDDCGTVSKILASSSTPPQPDEEQLIPAFHEVGKEATVNTAQKKPVRDEVLSRAASEGVALATQRDGEDVVSKTKKRREYILRKVELTNIGAEMQGARLVLGDICYDDFSQEMGTYILDDLVAVILKTLLATARENAKNAITAGSGLAGHVHRKASGLMDCFSKFSGAVTASDSGIVS